MDRKAFRNGMIMALIGAVLTLIGDLLLSSGAPAVSTGSAMLDTMVASKDNSDIRMMIGGLLGALGIPLEGIVTSGLSRPARNWRLQ